MVGGLSLSSATTAYLGRLLVILKSVRLKHDEFHIALKSTRLGELERTFLKSFCRGANFRGLLKTSVFQDRLPTLKPLLEKFYKLSSAGIKLEESGIWNSGSEDQIALKMDYKKAEYLSKDTYDAFTDYCEKLSHSANIKPDPSAQLIRHHTEGQIIYSSSSLDLPSGNSMIIYRSDGLEKAGQITEMFLHSNSPHLFLKVRPFAELEPHHRKHDPFASFPDLRARICYALHPRPFDIIVFSDIRSHFASWQGTIHGIPEKCIVVFSLDRVSTPPRLCIFFVSEINRLYRIR